MNHKQALFAAEYVKSGNATESAKLAGYSPKTAYSTGQRMLKNVEIKNAIREYREKASREAEVTITWWLKKMKQLVDFDPRRFFDEHGNLIPVSKLDEDCAAALCGLEVQEISIGSGDEMQLSLLKKIKFTDRRAALDLIGKHLGAYVNELSIINKLSDEDLDRVLDKMLSKMQAK